MLERLKAIYVILTANTFVLFGQNNSDEGICCSGGDRSDCINLLEKGHYYFSQQ